MQHRPFWFVGTIDDNEAFNRCLEEGIWFHNSTNKKNLDHVRSMKSGDRIAIKSTFTQKYDLPFDTNNEAVSTMRIKAIGTVTQESQDGGVSVRVSWKKNFQPRDWYFYTYRSSIWKVFPDENPFKANLVDFAFNNAEQDMLLFDEQNVENNQQHYPAWVSFYRQFAKKLLSFKDDRDRLIQLVNELKGELKDKAANINYLVDRDADKNTFDFDDIDPFSIFGIFNRRITSDNAHTLAQELCDKLGFTLTAPYSREGVPLLHPQAAFFLALKPYRQASDAQALWDLFSVVLSLSINPSSDEIGKFIRLYDHCLQLHGIRKNLSLALFWIRPDLFVPLDSYTNTYVAENAKAFNLDHNVLNQAVTNATAYYQYCTGLKTSLGKDPALPKDFIDLTLIAYQKQSDKNSDSTESEISNPIASIYTIDSIIDEGCFIGKDRLTTLLRQWQEKKNIILQGPPGTGKTWLAKRLAQALIGTRDSDRIQAVQFHANVTYEDFVRGWRPNAQGTLSLCDGPFMQAVSRANENPNLPYVFVIEEINRGHPAQIFGELLTLLEADKRNSSYALRLTHGEDTVYLPENLYVIGTMNNADRSLSMVDFALRRRFAFVNLEPCFNAAWENHLIQECGVTASDCAHVRRLMLDLNETLSSEATLGKDFQLGHSYVTPNQKLTNTDLLKWFNGVVQTEIQPLLEEYYFNEPERAQELGHHLLQEIAAAQAERASQA